MPQNSKDSKIFVVDGKSWIVGERKISVWSGSKCNKTEDNKSHVNKSEVNKSYVNKSDDNKSDDNKSEVDKTYN